MDQDRLCNFVLSFKLRQELVEIMDVPRAFDFRQHDDINLVAGVCDDLGDVVEHPRRVQAVDARPQSCGAEIKVARHGDEAFARGFLFANRDRVLEIAEHDIDLRNRVLQLGADLLVVGRDEVDHALNTNGQCAVRLRCPDSEGREMFGGRAGGSHGARNP